MAIKRIKAKELRKGMIIYGSEASEGSWGSVSPKRKFGWVTREDWDPQSTCIKMHMAGVGNSNGYVGDADQWVDIEQTEPEFNEWGEVCL